MSPLLHHDPGQVCSVANICSQAQLSHCVPCSLVLISVGMDSFYSHQQFVQDNLF